MFRLCKLTSIQSSSRYTISQVFDSIMLISSSSSIKSVNNAGHTNKSRTTFQRNISSTNPNLLTTSTSSTTKQPRLARRRIKQSFQDTNLSSITQNDDDDDDDHRAENDIKIIPRIKGEKFTIAAKQYLIYVENALQDMKSQNEVFILTRTTDNLTLGLKPGEGSYILNIDSDDSTIRFTSPMSGTYTYVLCSDTNRFVGMDDGHILEGLLVRDLIKHCYGLPKF